MAFERILAHGITQQLDARMGHTRHLRAKCNRSLRSRRVVTEDEKP